MGLFAASCAYNCDSVYSAGGVFGVAAVFRRDCVRSRRECAADERNRPAAQVVGEDGRPVHLENHIAGGVCRRRPGSPVVGLQGRHEGDRLAIATLSAVALAMVF